MIFVAAAALMIAALRLDEQNTCTPLSPVLAGSYLCMWLSGWGAHVRGRRVRSGVLVGLLLGPLGVIWAWSNPIPEGYSVVTDGGAWRPAPNGLGETRQRGRRV